MAQMAFSIFATGIPVIGDAGFAQGSLWIGIKTSTVKIFNIISTGETALYCDLVCFPFEIKEDSILDTLVNQRIDLSVSGTQVLGGDLSFDFKIYNTDGTPVYDESKSVYTKGTSLGGWSINSKRLKSISPSDKFYKFWKEALGFGEKRKALPCEDTMAGCN